MLARLTFSNRPRPGLLNAGRKEGLKAKQVIGAARKGAQPRLYQREEGVRGKRGEGRGGCRQRESHGHRIAHHASNTLPNHTLAADGLSVLRRLDFIQIEKLRLP